MLVASAAAAYVWIDQPWPGWPGLGDPQGSWALAAAVLGGFGALLAAGACLASAMERRPRPLLLLVLPSAALVVSAAGLVAHTGDVLALYAAAAGTRGSDSLAVITGYPAAAALYGLGLGATWAGVGFAAAIAAGASVPTAERVRRRFDPGPWAAGLLLVAVLAAVLLLGCADFPRVLRDQGIDVTIQRVGEAATGLATIRGGWLLLPQLPWVLALVALPAVLRPVVAGAAGELSHRGARIGLAVGGALGLGGAGALALMAIGGGRMLHCLVVLMGANSEAKQAFLANTWISGFPVVYAALPEAGAWLVLVGLLAVPAAIAARGELIRALVPVAFVALALLAAFGLRAVASVQVAGEFGPVCEQDCTELGRVTTVLRGGRPQRKAQMAYDSCGRMVNLPHGIRLPVLATDRCVEVGVILMVGREEVTLDDVDAGGLAALTEDGEAAELLRRQFAEKAEDAKAVAARNPNMPFRGRFLLAVDESHGWRVARAAIEAAGSGGFSDPRFLVAAHGSANPQWVRMVPVGLKPGTSTPASSTWGLALDDNWATILDPAGTSIRVPSGMTVADEVIRKIGPQAARSSLVICPADNQDVRAVLKLVVELTPRFDKTLVDPTCDEVWIAGSPDRYCDRFGATEFEPAPEP